MLKEVRRILSKTVGNIAMRTLDAGHRLGNEGRATPPPLQQRRTRPLRTHGARCSTISSTRLNPNATTPLCSSAPRCFCSTGTTIDFLHFLDEYNPHSLMSSLKHPNIVPSRLISVPQTVSLRMFQTKPSQAPSLGLSAQSIKNVEDWSSSERMWGLIINETNK